MNTTAEKLKAGMEKIDEGMKILSSGPLTYYTGEAQMMIAMLFDRFCPWKPGDFVMLVKPVDFEKVHGWKCAEHWLKPGAKGCVRSVGARNGLFTADVAFEDESWVDSHDSSVNPVPNSHVWGFNERQIVKVDERDQATRRAEEARADAAEQLRESVLNMLVCHDDVAASEDEVETAIEAVRSAAIASSAQEPGEGT